MDPAPDDDVSFELERFGWASEDRLEVAGRWHGVRRRLARPTLVVVVDGRRRRLRTLPGAWGSSPSGWEASFGWQGGPVELDGAELEVGRSIVVELPRPRRAPRVEPEQALPVPDTPPEAELSPEPEDGAALPTELDTARAEAQAARKEAEAARAALEHEREELAIARRSLSTAREAEEEERSDAQALRSELEALRSRQETLEEELSGTRMELAASQERSAAAEENAARSQPQDDPEPPGRRRFEPEPTEPTAEGAGSQRFNRARSDDRSTALLGARAGSLTERAAAWASGAAERTRDAFSSDSSADATASEVTRAPAHPQPQRIRARSVQRATELDSPSEPSWPLRFLAIGLVAILLVALALIVSFVA